MKLNTIIALITIMFIGVSLQAQNVSEFKPKAMKYGLNKLKNNPKKVYIASFNVNFEVYKEAIDYKASGGFRNTAKGEATARAAIGLEGLQKEHIQTKVDQLYNEFVQDLQSKGLILINPDQAGKTETYSGWAKASGPYIIESGSPGVLTCVPKNYSFFYKKETKSGKKKKGFMGGQFVPQKLSKDLDNAVVVDVNLYVMFSENGDNWLRGKGAQVKLFTNYRLINSYTISAPKENKVIGFKGAQSAETVSSTITYTQGKQGLGAKTAYTGLIKKDLEINGVIKKEKVVVNAKQGMATATSITPIVIVGPAYSKQTKWINVDSKKFAEGMYQAISKFVKYHNNQFLTNY